MLLLSIGLLLFSASNPYGHSPGSVALGLVAIAVMLAPFTYWTMFTERREVPYLGLHGIFLAATYGMGGLVYAAGYRGAFANYLSPSDFFVPLAYSLVSFVVVSAFYFMSRNKAVFPIPSSIKALPSKVSPDILVAMMLPLALLAYQIVTKQQMFSAIVQPVIAIRVFLLVWGSFLFFSGMLRPWQSVVYWLLVAFDVIFNSGIFSGFFADIIWYSLYFIVPFLVMRRRIPWLPIILVAVALFTLNPVKHEFRSVYSNFKDDREFSSEKIGVMVDLVGKELSELEMADLKENFDDFYARVLLITTYSIAVSDIPENNDFLMGETYLPFFTKFIPRLFWPGKPKHDSSGWALEYGYMSANSDAAYRLPLHVEMYLNFGLYGVVGVSAILGLIMGAARATFHHYSKNPAVSSLGFMVALPFFWAGERFATMFGGVVIQFISVFLFALLVSLIFGHSVRR